MSKLDRSRFVLRLMCVAMVALCVRTTAAHAVDAKSPTRVLFVGNSYTGANDLPSLIAKLAKAGGRDIEIGRVIRGGATLEQHWNGEAALERIRMADWDVVVLQEQSLRPLQDRPKMAEFAAKFREEIGKTKARTVFYMTWAQQATPEKQAGLTDAYDTIAAETKSEVAPVGAAWERAFAEQPGLELHVKDGSHPNLAGSYLAACVFHGTLFNEDPTKLGAIEGVKLSAEQQRFLQRIAQETLADRKAKATE